MKPFSKEQIINRIRFENPWWQHNSIEDFYFQMPKRLYFKLFYPLVENKKIKRAVVLMGPRRVGKTVMIYQAIQELIEKKGVSPTKIGYLSIETPIYNNIGLEQLFEYCRIAAGRENANGFYIFFDEIQYLTNWEVHLKSLVDSYHHTKFIASGSAAAALKLKSNESGAGRFTDFMLPPLTFNEYIDLKKLNQLAYPIEKKWGSSKTRFYESRNLTSLNNHFEQYINFGGYPEIIFSQEIIKNPGRYIRNDIVDKVLLRDLPSLYGIRNVQQLNTLFNVIAYNSGNEFSFKSLTVNSGVDEPTIKRYLEYLEAAFLIKVVYRIDQSAKRFKRLDFFKIYLTNPSLRSALFSPLSQNDDNMGNMVETAIFAQWFHRGNDGIHYARWKNGEVDIVGLGAKLTPRFAVEIKWSNRFYHAPKKLKSLLSFCKKNNIERAMVTSIDKTEIITINEIELHFVPASLYCYTVGRNLKSVF